jgi:hypothetical protein
MKHQLNVFCDVSQGSQTMKWQTEPSLWRNRPMAVIATTLLFLSLLFALTGVAQGADRTPADTGHGVEQIEATSAGRNELELTVQAPRLSAQVKMLRGVMGDDLYLYPVAVQNVSQTSAQMHAASGDFRHGRIVTE